MSNIKKIMNKTLIVIFCYNVGQNIKDLYENIKKFKLKHNRDILFIDDCSTDNTNKIIRSFNVKNFKLIRNKFNQGYGLNYKFSIKYSIRMKYKNLIFLHGDNQYPSNKVSLIEKKLRDFDLCYGSRKLNIKSMYHKMPILRFTANVFLTTFINLLLKSNCTEYFSGLRGFKIEKLKSINLSHLANDWVIEQQIHFEFIKKKFSIYEFAIPSSYKKTQISRIPPFRYVFSVVINALKYSS
jgi:glycosyltransferase involved in cell wall biosynthesis